MTPCVLRSTGEENGMKRTLPDHDNGEIQQIPRASKVRRGMLPETVSYDFHDALGGKND